MKLICDEMLIKLGRWLRLAGYDTLIAEPGMSDRALIELARQQGRVLITRDRKLMEYKHAATSVILLDCKLMDQCLEEISHKLHINWLNDPFSRCMNCNTLLIAATQDQFQSLPDKFKKTVTGLCYCPSCRQLYWEGGHVRRMRQKLQVYSKSFGDT